MSMRVELSRVSLFVTLWTVAQQAPLSMGFSRQGHWSGLPRPPPGGLPDPETEPAWQVDTLPLEPPGQLLRNSYAHISKRSIRHRGMTLPAYLLRMDHVPFG